MVNHAMPTNRVIVDLEAVTNTCFVAMPFHELYKAEYDLVIKPAIELAGLTCIRGDEIYSEQPIIGDIWSSIRKARLVVAELTSRNPNVMYEIGLAHAIGKPIIFLTRNKKDVPFDLQLLRYMEYDINYPRWGDELCTKLARYIKESLDKTTLQYLLAGVLVEAQLPPPPTQPVASTEELLLPVNLSGQWHAEWPSPIDPNMKREGLLEIPQNHARTFIASMTVVYEGDSEEGVAVETLTGSFSDKPLSLTGINFTSVKRDASRVYNLHSFELKLAEDGKALHGKAILAHGERDVSFRRKH
jgi:hypothetical protein